MYAPSREPTAFGRRITTAGAFTRWRGPPLNRAKSTASGKTAGPPAVSLATQAISAARESWSCWSPDGTGPADVNCGAALSPLFAGACPDVAWARSAASSEFTNAPELRSV